MTAPDDVRARFEAWFERENPSVNWAASAGEGEAMRFRAFAWNGYRAAHADLAGEVRELVDAARGVERRLIPLLSGKLHDIDHADFVAFFAALAPFTTGAGQ